MPFWLGDQQQQQKHFSKLIGTGELTHLRHYRLPLSILDVAKGHLGAFVLVDSYLGIIDIRHGVEWSLERVQFS